MDGCDLKDEQIKDLYDSIDNLIEAHRQQLHDNQIRLLLNMLPKFTFTYDKD